MHKYLSPLITLFQSHADSESAVPMKKYMRDKFEYLGIKSPQRKELQKKFIAEHGLPPQEELGEISRQLWALPEREFQYIAVNFLDRCQKNLTPEHLPLLEYLIVTKSWWDTVDGLAIGQVGRLLIRYPKFRDRYINNWRGSDNFWLRRTTLLFQFPCKENTDKALLFDLIWENLDSNEFFIQKAIGWALREYSKSNAESVINFVAQTELPPLSHREALKWLKNKGKID